MNARHVQESATTRLQRLLTMVPWLLANQGVATERAAEQFGVSTDQLESDLALLFLCGTPGHLPDDLIEADWEDGHVYIGGAGISRGDDLSVELLDGPDVHAARRLVGHQQAHLAAQRPSEHDLLLIAPAEALAGCIGPRAPDVERREEPPGVLGDGGEAAQAESRERRAVMATQDQVVGDRPLHDQRVAVAVFGDVRHARIEQPAGGCAGDLRAEERNPPK